MNAGRTAEHEEMERQAAEMGVPYPLPIRTLSVTIEGVNYRIKDAISSWHAIDGEALCCTRCQQPLQTIDPDFMHELAIVYCPCRSSYLTPE
jgi:hypothetical protein